MPEVGEEGVMTQQKFRDIVMNNINAGGYLQRRYQAFNNKNYDITGQARRVLIDKIKGRVRFGEGDSPVVNIEDVQKQLRGKDVPTTFKLSDEDVQAYKNGTYNLTEKQADLYIQKKLENAKKAAGFDKSPMVTRFVAERINPAIINKTKIDNQLEREILGQIKDPREAYIATVSELSKFIATDAYYKTFRQAVNKAMREGNEAYKTARAQNKTIDRQIAEARARGMSEKEIQSTFPKVDEKKPMFLTFDEYLERKVVSARRARPNDVIETVSDLKDEEIAQAFKKILEKK